MKYSILRIVAAIAGKLALCAALLKAKLTAWRIPSLKAAIRLRFKSTLTANLRIGVDAVAGSAVGPYIPDATQTLGEGEPAPTPHKAATVRPFFSGS